ncbi:MAG: hypothetical protein ACOYW3_16495, partial [Bacteroidota bacterium]
GLDQLTALKTLDVGSCGLYSCEDVSFPPNLNHLALNDNRLSVFPMGILTLKRLRRIDLQGNIQIKHIPDGITELRNLKFLNLKDTGVPGSEIEYLKIKMPWCKIE